MKMVSMLLISFCSIIAFAQSDTENLAINFAAQGNACSVQPAIISYVHGGEAALPGKCSCN